MYWGVVVCPYVNNPSYLRYDVVPVPCCAVFAQTYDTRTWRLEMSYEPYEEDLSTPELA